MMESFSLGIPLERCQQWLESFFRKHVKERVADFIHDEKQLQCLSMMANWLVEPGKKYGLFLAGVAGNGKTTSVLAMRDLINHCQVRDPIGSTLFSPYAGIWFMTARELMAQFSLNRKKYEACKETYILAIDDFGTEESIVYEYRNIYKPMEDLLSYRYSRMLPTIITSNLPMAAIREKYGDRVSERFNEMMFVIHMPDRNFRV